MILDSPAQNSSVPYDGLVGVAVDIPVDGGTLTVVAMSDDTTSFYTSTGGGSIGMGEHQVAAMASRALLAAVRDHIHQFHPDDDQGLPPAGQVRIHVLAHPSSAHVDLPEPAFWGEVDHELWPVIARVQDVMSAIRSVTEA